MRAWLLRWWQRLVASGMEPVIARLVEDAARRELVLLAAIRARQVAARDEQIVRAPREFTFERRQ